MAITLLQTKQQNGGGYNTTNAGLFASSVNLGSLLVLSITFGTAGTINSVADNINGSWTLAILSTGTDRKTAIYYFPGSAPGTITVTVTFAAGEDSVLIAREYSGIAITAPLDKTASAIDTTFQQSHNTGTTSTTTQNDELVVAAGGGSSNGTWTAGTGYGNIASQNGFDLFTSGGMDDKITSTTGAQTETFTTDTFPRGEGCIATFKAALNSGFFQLF